MSLKIAKVANLEPIKCLFIVLVVALAIFSAYMHFNCYDDGGYLAISNMAIEYDLVEINDTVVYSGNYFFEDACARPAIASWEFFMAFWSKMIQVPVAIVFHTVMPLLLIPLYFFAIREVFVRITHTKKQLYLALIISLIIYVFYNNGYLISSYLAVGAWTGKAVLWHLILPLIMANCIDIYKDNDDLSTWAKIGILAVAGVGATATGIYTVPFYCISLGLPKLIHMLVQKEWKTFGNKILSICISMSGLIVIGLFAVAQMIQLGNRYGEAYATLSIKNVYIKALSYNKVYLILFIISMLLMLFVEKQKEIKLMFLGSVSVLCVLFLNPLFAGFIAKNLTGMPVYWRMFLMLPLPIIIPMGVVWLMQLLKNKLLKGLGICIVVGAIVAGGNMFTVYTMHQNLYMIPDEVLDICEELYDENKTVVIFADQTINKFFRQYSAKFDVVVGRNDQIGNSELANRYHEMYESVFVDGIIDESTIASLECFDVQYIISATELEVIGGYILKEEISGYYIYQYIVE